MLNSYRLSKEVIIYYDLVRGTIARSFSKSNLYQKGSDNSLYLGTADNPEALSVFQTLCGAKTSENFSSNLYELKSPFNISFLIRFEISSERQLRIHFLKPNNPFKVLADKVLELHGRGLERNDYLVVIDISERVVRIKLVYQMEL